MHSEFIRISHSIDAIETMDQVAPTFRWIRLFKSAFKDEMGIEEKTQLLLNQLSTIEL